MLAMRSGNLILRHWVLATDNFFFTDSTPFTLISFLFGTAPRLIYIVPFLIFDLLLAACLLLVRGVARTRGERLAGSYLVLMLLGVPYGLYYNFFFWNDFHVATVTTCLYAIVFAEPALSVRQFNRLRLIPFTFLIFAAAFSDPLADGLLLLPLLMLIGLRAWLSHVFRLDDWLLAACVLLGVGASLLTMQGLRLAGGFVTQSSVNFSFVSSVDEVVHNFHALLGGGQMLFTARAPRIMTLPLHHIIAVTRQITAVFVALLCLAVLWRMPRTPQTGVAQLLVFGGACLAAMDVISSTFSASVATGIDFPGAAVRFILPIFVFFCLAAVLEGQSLFIRCSATARRSLGIISLCFALIYSVGGISAVRGAIAAPPGIQRAPQRALADWLQQNCLRYGVGDYWDTQMIHALSRGTIIADPATQVGNRLLLYPWLTDTSRFGYNIPPQFVIIRPSGLFHIDLAGVTATYGKPTSITEVADFYFVVRFSSGCHQN